MTELRLTLQPRGESFPESGSRMTYHLLKCRSGHEITVASADAGITVTCWECLTTVRVPELSQLRLLPAVEGKAGAENETVPTNHRLRKIARALLLVGWASFLSSMFFPAVTIRMRLTSPDGGVGYSVESYTGGFCFLVSVIPFYWPYYPMVIPGGIANWAMLCSILCWRNWDAPPRVAFGVVLLVLAALTFVSSESCEKLFLAHRVWIASFVFVGLAFVASLKSGRFA